MVRTHSSLSYGLATVCALLFFCAHWIGTGISLALFVSAAFGLVIFLGSNSPSIESRKDFAGPFIITVLVIIYVAASLGKLNGSSIALWRPLLDRHASVSGVVLGTPKAVRTDEWAGETPWIFSQAARGFSRDNPGLGGEGVPLLTNLPARHWSMIFRPQMWAFFCCDFEHAFAFYWNFKWFSFLLGAFLFLRCVANDSYTAIFGALLLFFSQFVQWWFSTPTAMPEMVGAFFLALWGLVMVWRAPSRWAVGAVAILAVAAIAQFVFCAYPRFQIPLVYLALFLGVAARKTLLTADSRWFRAALFVLVIVVSFFIVACWQHDVAAALRRISSLEYPGKTFYTGGTFDWREFFPPFFSLGMTETNFPARLGNVCEASGFLFLAPFLIFYFALELWRRRCDALIAASVIFIVCAIWFMSVGIPASAAKVTGWSLVEPRRVQLAIAVASVIALCRQLRKPAAHSNGKPFFVATLFAAVLLFLILQNANQHLHNFVGTIGLILAAIFFAIAFAALWQRRLAIAAILLLIPAIGSTALINPINRSLRVLTGDPVFRQLQAIHQANPGAKWLVIGPAGSARARYLPQLLKAIGADVYGGFRVEPEPAMIRALDPAGKYSSVYNRYAEISIVPSNDPTPRFELTFVNTYNIFLPLRSEILDAMHVTYILEVDLPSTLPALASWPIIGENQDLRLLRR